MYVFILISLLALITNALRSGEFKKERVINDFFDEVVIDTKQSNIKLVGTDKQEAILITTKRPKNKKIFHLNSVMVINDQVYSFNNKGTVYVNAKKVSQDYDNQDCDVCNEKLEVVGSKLQLTSDCKYDYELHVPFETLVALKSGAGNINLTDLSGNVKVEANAGNIQNSGTLRQAHVKLNAGNVDLSISESAKIKLNAGNACVAIADNQQEKTNVLIEVNAGNTHVEIPKNRSVDYTSSNSCLKHTFNEGANPDITVNAKTRAGRSTFERS